MAELARINNRGYDCSALGFVLQRKFKDVESRMRFWFIRLTVVLSLVLASAAGAEEKVKNSLAALPSEPGAHIKKIEALGDNEWINLGQSAADPKWGVARGRSWCSKMSYASDLGGAFFCGTGVHGATPDGRYMDDLWFYDAYAHRWICLYPGADPKSLKLKLDERCHSVGSGSIRVTRRSKRKTTAMWDQSSPRPSIHFFGV